MKAVWTLIGDKTLEETVVGHLQQADYVVSSLPSPAEAARQLVVTPYTTVITDASLFLPDSLSTLEDLLESAPYAQIILVVDPKIGKTESMMLLHAGASDFVTKPVTSFALLAVVRRAQRHLTWQVQHLEEQWRYKQLFDSLLDGYALHEIICDDEGNPVNYRFLDINPAFERITGLGKDVIGKTVLEVLPGTESYWIEQYGDVALTGKTISFTRRSGELEERLFNVVAFSPARGQFVTVFEDVTNRKKAEEALSYQASLLENVSDAIISSDLDFNIRSWNRAAEEIYGWHAEDVVGRNVGEVLQADFMGVPTEQVVEQFLETGLWEGEVIHRREDGEPVHILGSTTLFRDEEGHSIGVVSVNRDITERRRVEGQLRVALDESRRRQAEVSALLHSARAVLQYQDFTIIARAIFDSCKELLGARAGYVALLAEDGAENELLFLDAGGLPCTVDPELPMPIRGLRAEAYNTGQVVYDNDFFNSEWVSFLPEGHVYMGSVLFSPLTIDGVTTGLLGLANKPGGFTDDDARMAAAFGELAAIALRNTRTLDELERRTGELHERVKELNCLYGISALVEQPDITLDGVLQGTVELLPLAWQTPEATSARIVIEDQSYQTANFQETTLCQSVPLSIYGEQVGNIEVYLLNGRVPDTLSFLPEERALLRAVAERLGRIVERMRIEAQFQRYTQQLERLVEEKVAELEHERAKTIQSAKLAALGEMATGIAHEINQPLTAILFDVNYLRSLSAKWADLSPGDYWQDVGRVGEGLSSDVERIRRITDHLRAFGRISGGHTTSTDINTPIENSFILVGARLEEHEIDLRVTLEPDLPLISVDPNRLEQVFINLVSNAEYALKEMARRVASGESDRPNYQKVLEISTFLDDAGEVVATVRDNGCGIPAADQERLFEPFFTTKPIGEGTGLGLSISYGIVRDMGGDITFTSIENEGTTFTVRFPPLSAEETQDSHVRPTPLFP
jgi:PAS domain S-box-containing protein